MSHFQKLTMGKGISPTQLTGGGGHLVVVDYMATWCAPCQKMYPLVDDLLPRLLLPLLIIIFVLLVLLLRCDVFLLVLYHIAELLLLAFCSYRFLSLSFPPGD